MNGPITVESLNSHPFVQEVFPEAVRIQHSLNDQNPNRVNPDYERDPDEHEYYILSVGHTLAELLSLVDQIAHAPIYMSRFPQTAATRRAGITRDKHILYHIENHLIRLHAAFDRCLSVVDAVFHLTNAPAALSQTVVASNLRVKRTDVPKRLKAIRKTLGPTIDARNDVIHHHAYKEDSLRKLEMFCLAERILPPEESGPLRKTYLRYRVRELTSEVLKKKTAEIGRVNAELLTGIIELLSELLPIYKREKAIIRARTEPSVS
jgi:hypothetical protein